MRRPAQKIATRSRKTLEPPQPKSYIFTANGTKLFDGTFIPPSTVIKERLKRGYWPLNETTKHRKSFNQGDVALLYATRPLKTFIAVASIRSQCMALSIRERDKLEAEFDHLLGTPYIVEIGDPIFLPSPVPIQSVITELGFITNKAYWWVFLQGGAIKTERQDYELVLKKGFAEQHPGTDGNL